MGFILLCSSHHNSDYTSTSVVMCTLHHLSFQQFICYQTLFSLEIYTTGHKRGGG